MTSCRECRGKYNPEFELINNVMYKIDTSGTTAAVYEVLSINHCVNSPSPADLSKLLLQQCHPLALGLQCHALQYQTP